MSASVNERTGEGVALDECGVCEQQLDEGGEAGSRVGEQQFDEEGGDVRLGGWEQQLDEDGGDTGCAGEIGGFADSAFHLREDVLVCTDIVKYLVNNRDERKALTSSSVV